MAAYAEEFSAQPTYQELPRSVRRMQSEARRLERRLAGGERERSHLASLPGGAENGDEGSEAGSELSIDGAHDDGGARHRHRRHHHHHPPSPQARMQSRAPSSHAALVDVSHVAPTGPYRHRRASRERAADEAPADGAAGRAEAAR